MLEDASKTKSSLKEKLQEYLKRRFCVVHHEYGDYKTSTLSSTLWRATQEGSIKHKKGGHLTQEGFPQDNALD